ncbi:MAG: hypothetical protein K9L84_01145 [Candidatus Omnitrophica bacterium]|nr:hypothetical protein [Candidatus Omnitrophota bacterium]MCF7893657.1 hypothetical protein [Candidatus Omnitrophota bacterium]
MKKEYKLGEDLFLIAAVILIGFSCIIKLLDFNFLLGPTVVTASSLLKLGVVALLFNIALNIQDIARK